MDNKLNILSLEDSIPDFEIICNQLNNEGYNLNISRVDTEKEFIFQLQNQKYDIILSDFNLPNFDAFGALKWSNEICPDIPFICVSGSIGEETAIELIKQGAVDYVLKDKLGRLAFSIERALFEAEEKMKHQQVEDALKESEQNYRTIANSGQALIWLSGIDKKYYFFNTRWLEFTGRKPEQEIGIGWTYNIHPNDFQKCIDIYNDAFDKRMEFSMEYRLKRNDGKYRWIIDEGCPRYNSKGEFIGYIGHCLDITKLIVAEREARESSRRFTEIMKSVSLVSLILDNNAKISFCNDYLLNITGYTRDEVQGQDWFELFIPTDISEMVKVLFLNAIGKEELTPQFENEIRTKMGDRLLISWNNTILRDINENIIGAASIGEDITTRKKIENDLFQSESKFRALVESSSDLIWETNTDRVYTYISPQITEILGYTIEETIMKSPFTFVVDDEKEEIISKSNSIVDAGVPFNSLVNKYMHKNGSIVYMETNGMPVFNKKGKLTGYRGVSRDITARKIDEETILRFKRIFDLAPFGSVIANTSCNIVYVNNYFTKVHGFENTNLIGEPLSIFHTKEQYILIEQKIEDLMQSGMINSVEMMHHHQNGTDFPMLMNGLLLYTEKNEPEFIVATAIDNTENKKAEAKIKDQLEELRRWYEATLDREDRILELKQEVNELLKQNGEALRYGITISDFPAVE